MRGKMTYSDEFRAVIRQNNFVILDTETTGLEWPAEIVEIAVIDWTGAALVNSRVKPVRPIPAGASAVHGIFDKDVADAPEWRMVRAAVFEAVRGKDVVIYNAAYDIKLGIWTERLHKTKGENEWAVLPAWCAMEWYAQYWGDWDDYHKSFTWQRLTKAMGQQGLGEKIAGAHGALGDCLMTRELVLHVCAKMASQELRGSDKKVAKK